MGDRDGDDEPASDEPAESDTEDSPADEHEQQVPSSTAADAKADDDASADEQTDADDADGDTQTGRGGRRRSPEEAAASDESGGDGDDGTSDDYGSGNWSPPTTDDVEETFERVSGDSDGEPDEDEADDAAREEWWTDHDPASEADASPTDDGESDDEDGDDLPPAARRDQTEAPDSAEGDGANRANGSSRKHAHVPDPTPKGGGGGDTTPSGTARPTREYDDDVEPPTAPDDEEMPLTEHVEEMALRFLAVGLVMFGVAGIVVFYANDLINFLWYSFLGDPAACPGPTCEVKPRVYHPLSLVLARLKVSTLVGLIVALPVGVYQTYRFMRPGLYPRERRYYLAAVPTSLVLAVVGVGFAYFAVLPSLFAYFTEYSEQAATTAFGLTETFNLMVLMLGFFALVFQIPLLVMLAIMMGVTTRQWLEDRRLYFWGGFAAVAFLFSPDPTGMAPLIVAVTMIVLFEGTLTLLRWTGTGSPILTAEEAADRRPVAYLLAGLGAYVASAGPIPPGYYDALPTVVTEQLASTGGPIATPAILAGALIALFEVGAFLLRRYGRSRRALKARLAVQDARIPIWLGAVVVGYFGSPNPTLIDLARDLALAPTRAALVGVGLIVLYELFVAVLRWREGREAAETPTTEEA